MVKSRKYWFSACLVVLCLLAGTVSALAEKVQIQFATGLGGDQLEEAKRRIAVFEEQNPDIDVEILPFTGGFGRLAEKLLLMVGSGSMPDVIHTVINDADMLIKNGVLMDVASIVEVSGFDRSEYIPFAGIYDRDGKVYGGFESHVQVYPFYYNVDTVAAAGLVDLNTFYEQGDWTWDTLVQVGKKLTKDQDGDGTPDVYGIGRGWWLNYLVSNHIFYVNETKDKIIIDDPKAIEAMQFFIDLQDKFQVGIGAGYNELVNGKVAMYNDGSWIMNIFKQFKPGINWDIVSFPRKDRNTEPLYLRSPGAWALVTTGTKHPREAWRLVQFFLGSFNQLEEARAKLVVPVRWEALTSDIYMEAPPAHMNVILDMLSKSMSEPVFTGTSQVMRAMWGELAPAFSGDKPVSEAARQAAKVAQALLEEMRSE